MSENPSPSSSEATAPVYTRRTRIVIVPPQLSAGKETSFRGLHQYPNGMSPLVGLIGLLS